MKGKLKIEQQNWLANFKVVEDEYMDGIGTSFDKIAEISMDIPSVYDVTEACVQIIRLLGDIQSLKDEFDAMYSKEFMNNSPYGKEFKEFCKGIKRNAPKTKRRSK